MRQFPAPWTIEALDGGFKVTLCYVYGQKEARDAEVAKGLTLDEARRIAANVAKLPKPRDRRQSRGKFQPLILVIHFRHVEQSAFRKFP